MRVVAVCAIVAFLAWASEQALDRPATIDAGIAQARYVVYPPAAAATVPASSGNVSTSVVTLRYFDPVAAVAQEPTTTAVPTPTGDVPQSASTAPATASWRVDGP